MPKHHENSPLTPGGPITVVAHRGASAYAPENTLTALRLGADLGADLVETDVRMTRDGELVLLHDASLARTTDAAERYPRRWPWLAEDFTLEEISTLDAGSWFDAEFAGERVPTLREALAELDGRAGVLAEFKQPARYPSAAAAATGVLGRGGVVVQSFDRDFLRELDLLRPDVPVGFLGRPPRRWAIRRLSRWAHLVNTRHSRVTAGFIEAVHRHGMVTWPWTVDGERRMRELLALGVDGVITNRPDVLLGVLCEERDVVGSL